MMSAGGRGIGVFAAAFALGTCVAAQCAPGWAAGAPLPPLHPDPLGGVPGACTGASTSSHLAVGETPALLTMPTGGADVVVVHVPGAGRATRDTLQPQAKALASCGVGSVTFNKSGLLAIAVRDFDRWELETREVITAVRAIPGVKRVVVAGWSEGSWIAARVLDSVDAAVLLGAPVVSPTDQVSWAVDSALAGTPDAVRRIPAVALSSPAAPQWTREDSLPALGKSPTPLLAMWGANDHVAPTRAAIEKLRSARPDASVMVQGHVGHTLPGDEWAKRVARWLETPAPALTQGAEPAAAHPLPILPEQRWFTHPFTLAVVAAAVVLVDYLLRRNP